jgi:predicted outer membrane repeat protein
MEVGMNKRLMLHVLTIFILLAASCTVSQTEPTPMQVEPTSTQVEPSPVQVLATSTLVEPTLVQVLPTSTQVKPTPTRVEPLPTLGEPTPTQVRPTFIPVETTPTPVRTPSTLYVRAIPAGLEDCSSWANACDLQIALFKTARGDKVWVAAGVYYPGTVPDSSFHIESGVEVYGGFPPAGGSLMDRDWVYHPTVLSGDIDQDDITNYYGVITDTNHIVGKNAYHVVDGSGANESAVLDGFIVTAGYASQTPPRTDGFGGGMINWGGSPTLNNIVFQGNTAGKGAAYYCGGGMLNIHSSYPVLTNVSFIANTAGGGAGMCNAYNSSPRLTHVTFTNNTAIDGACMDNGESSPVLNDVVFDGNISANKGCMNNHVNSYPTLTRVTFSNNTAKYGSAMYNYQSSPRLKDVIFDSNISSFVGGAIYNQDHSTPSFNDVLFTKNSALQEGGAIFNDKFCNLTLMNVAFVDNTVRGEGGGGGIKIYNSSPILINVTFSGNHALVGGGIDTWQSHPSLSNVTFSANTADQAGGAIFGQESTLTMINSIAWGNTPLDLQVNIIRGSSNVTYSIIEGGFPGVGNQDVNPQLEPLADNGGFTPTYALQFGSPAIDAGSQLKCPQTDQRGVPRPVDGERDGTAGCDMGAYEAPSTP